MTTLGVERGAAIAPQQVGDSPAAARVGKPRWTQFRFVGGVLLIVLSVLLGASIVSRADQSIAVWTAARDLPAGATLGDGDVVAVRVRLFDNPQQYLSADAAAPVGYVLLRPVGRGEFVPATAITPAGEQGDGTREVTLGVGATHRPADLRPGDVVDVYVTTKASPDAPAVTELVLEAVTVARVPSRDGGAFSAGGGGEAVALRVAEADAETVVQSSHEGTVDLVRHPFPRAER